MNTVIVDHSQKNPGCLVQILWFVFIGWWAGQLWIILAWLLMLTILGIPLSIAMLNKLPKVIAFRGETHSFIVTREGEEMVITTDAPVSQHNIILRALYFILIGWWFSAIWMEVAYLICLTIIGLPIGFWMFDRVPALVSLHRG